MLKQIFIITGEPRTGKSILFNQAAYIKAHDEIDKIDFIIKDAEYPKSILIDNFSLDNKSSKKLVCNIIECEDYLDYITIITNCEKEKLHLLTDRLKSLEIPISICEMRKL